VGGLIMDTKDYRIIMTIASSIARPCRCEGKLVYELDLELFINAIDNIYPDICVPVSRNGVVLNPKTKENTEEVEC
jgi:hypothetical protein